MAVPPRNAVLRLSPTSVVLAVVLLGLALVGLATLAASTRVIGWILAAATLAGLLHPVVERLGSHLPRALALGVVVLVSVGVAAGIGYAVVDELSSQLRELQVAVPKAAREVERSERFGDVAKEIDLAEKAEDFVDELPRRLRGGDVQDAIRSAATRGVAFLATGVLTIFFLIHGPRLLGAAVRQLPAARQGDARRVGLAVYRRTWSYLAGALSMATMAGLVAYGCAYALDLPGKAPLALWMALLGTIPLVGVVIGSAPLILLAGTTATAPATLAVTAALLGWQAFEALWLQRQIEARSLHLGPFVTVAVGMVGLELYGIGGALIGLVVVVLLAATLDEAIGHGPRSAAASLSSGAP